MHTSTLLLLHLPEGPSHTLLPLDGALYDCAGVNNSIFGTLCQNESHEHSRCTFWVAAIRVHLGSNLLASGRFGGRGMVRPGEPRAPSSPVSFSDDLSQGRTFSV